MSSVTPRLGLELPDTNDSMKKGDSVLASNYRIIDKNMHFRHESALSNITVPFRGQLAVDTSAVLPYYYNSGWKLIGSSISPVNKLSADVLATEGSDAGPAGTPSKVQEVNVTMATGRRYALTVCGCIIPNTANSYAPQIHIRTSSSPTVVGDTILFQRQVPSRDGIIGSTKSMNFSWTFTFQAATVGVGSKYFGVWLETNAAAITTTYRATGSSNRNDSILLIEDIGT